MLGLTKLFLRNYPEYQVGLILVGIAPCIAMVLIWNLLAGGDNEKAAILVAINSLLQIFLYSLYAYFLISSSIEISMWDVAKNVLFYLRIPLVAGFLTRLILTRVKGYEWYDQKFIKKLGPTALIGLLFTIVVMFSMQGEKIIEQPLDILLISVPLLIFFVLMFTISFITSWLLKFKYKDTVTIAFTSASNNFELAIAVAVGVFGISSMQALATTVGPLIEVPILLALVYLAKWLQKKMFKEDVILSEKSLQESD
jgi:ACR3 family arsenite transporter